MAGVVPPRIRVRYTKTGRIKYTSQRDVARVFERALRRARLPVAYSEGFSPRPLLSFSLALPTACESLAEYVDLRFDARSETPGGLRVDERASSDDLAQIADLLDGLLPDGLEVVSAAVLEGSEGSLQEEVTSCSWIVEVTGMSAVELEERVASVLDAETIPVERERKGRRVSDDLRPGILRLTVEGTGASPGVLRLDAELATKPRGVRPSELLGAIATTLRLVRVSRVAQWTVDHDGQRHEPLTADGVLLGAVDTATVGGR
jgi:radical SAM-linked protein